MLELLEAAFDNIRIVSSGLRVLNRKATLLFDDFCCRFLVFAVWGSILVFDDYTKIQRLALFLILREELPFLNNATTVKKIAGTREESTPHLVLFFLPTQNSHRQGIIAIY